MSALAKLCHANGLKVSGSDCKKSQILDELTNLGIKTFSKHSRENIKDIDMVVYTIAGGEDNEEILEAKDIIKILGGEIKLVEKYDIFGNSRSIVIIKKISNTPQKYPRKPNQIK